MLGTLAICLLAASQTPDATREKLVVLDVTSPDLEKAQVESLTQKVSARAARFPVEILPSDYAGCDRTQLSCLSEIAAALHADYVLATRAGKLDANFVVTFQIFERNKNTADRRTSAEAWSLLEVADKMGPALDEILGGATGADPGEHAVAAATQSNIIAPDLRFGLEVGGGIAAGIGGLTAAIGAIPAFSYSAKKTELRDRTLAFTGEATELTEASAVQQEAEAQRTLYNDVGRWAVATGTVLLVVGTGSLLTGIFLPAEKDPLQ